MMFGGRKALHTRPLLGGARTPYTLVTSPNMHRAIAVAATASCCLGYIQPKRPITCCSANDSLFDSPGAISFGTDRMGRNILSIIWMVSGEHIVTRHIRTMSAGNVNSL